MKQLVLGTALVLGLFVAQQEDPAKNLKSKDVSLRLSAIDRLAQEKSAKNEKAIVSALKDSDWEVVDKAADALGKAGSADSIPELVELALNGPIARVRISAALSLAAIDAVKASEALAKKATGKDPTRALEALATLCSAREAKYELKGLERQVETAKEDVARAAAARALAATELYVGGGDGDALVKLATSAHAEVACATLEVLLAHPDLKRAASLVRVLQHPVLADLVERRGEAALAAAIRSQQGDPAIAAALEPHVSTLIGAREAPVAARGVRTLVRVLPLPKGESPPPPVIGADKLVALLRPALAHTDAGVRAQAAAALARVRGDETWKEAKALAGDKEERVRLAALGSMTSLRNARDADTRALLVEHLATDASSDVRIRAATLLGVAANAEARTALEKALEDKDWAVAACSAVSLGKIRSAESVTALAKLLKSSPDWKLRGAAVEGLLQCDQNAAMPPLIEALADTDPSVRHGSYVFLVSVSEEKLAEKVDPWREWWKKNGSTFDLAAVRTREARKKPQTVEPGKPRAYATAVDIGIWRNLDVIVLQSRGDHIETVLADQTIEHRLTSSGKVAESGLHPGAVFVSNCTGEIEAGDVERLRWFVLTGGHLFGSCWALHETIEKVTPGVVRKCETRDEVVDRVPASACVQGSAYLEGVVTPLVVPVYALEGAHLIEVLAPERCEVLLDSPLCLSRWGSGNLAVLFDAGHGTVVDSVNHYAAQTFETVEGLKTAIDRQAWAVDHMGLPLDELRKNKGEKWWENSVRASEQIQDLSVFRLVTNIVKERRSVAAQ